MEENPDATEQELFELLVDALKDEPEVRDAIIREYVWRVTAHRPASNEWGATTWTRSGS
jgi:hypothetical protein